MLALKLLFVSLSLVIAHPECDPYRWEEAADDTAIFIMVRGAPTAMRTEQFETYVVQMAEKFGGQTVEEEYFWAHGFGIFYDVGVFERADGDAYGPYGFSLEAVGGGVGEGEGTAVFFNAASESSYWEMDWFVEAKMKWDNGLLGVETGYWTGLRFDDVFAQAWVSSYVSVFSDRDGGFAGCVRLDISYTNDPRYDLDFDRREGCAFWATTAQCSENPNFMCSHCVPSCGEIDECYGYGQSKDDSPDSPDDSSNRNSSPAVQSS